jgi:hypothetical protein
VGEILDQALSDARNNLIMDRIIARMERLLALWDVEDPQTVALLILNDSDLRAALILYDRVLQSLNKIEETSRCRR